MDEDKADENPAPKDSSAETTDLASQLAAVTGEKAELQDRFLRRQAEFENFRRRVERDRAEFLEFAGMESVRAILPILDDFERAIKVECTDRVYAKGMEQIYQRLLDALKKLGLEPIESKGNKFDPYLHHAVERAPAGQAEEDTILEEFQGGYNFKGRLLRPAMVRVAVKA